jgi:pimeloyl-ACP methyl ester carboxylesterase
MVDVGGHQLHILCTGAGGPTVVFEAPAAGLSAAWSLVQPRVSGVTRSCSYDRAGLGWSERGDGTYDAAETVDELQSLLKHAGEKPPFVVVGQGLGAALAAMFAARFGNETAALVLVDTPAGGIEGQAGNAMGGVNGLTPWLARVGILRAAGSLSDRAAGLPPPWDGALRAFLNRPDHLARSADEISRWDETARMARDATLPAGVSVSRVDTGSRRRIAFLTSELAAAPVVSAILAAVNQSRGRVRSTAAPPGP